MTMNIGTWLSIIGAFLKEHLLSLGLFLAIFAIFLTGLNSTQEESRQEGLRIVEESISRSIVTCYSIEGIYPDGLAHLQENYGLVIDESKYYVQYEVFASNIMPQVTVIEVGT